MINLKDDTKEGKKQDEKHECNCGNGCACKQGKIDECCSK
jgi:hypothetical protein